MAHGGHHPREQHGHHIIPLKTLLTVFGALVLLTIFTVISAQWDLGPLNVPLALAIATVKAGLVVAFFMALKYDNRVNAMVFSFGVIFVVLFLSFTVFDTVFRGDVGNVSQEPISDIERAEEQLRARDPGPGGPMAPAPATEDDADGPASSADDVDAEADDGGGDEQ